MASFHVRGKVCIALFQVRSKFAVFAPHIEVSNADFALHMEGSNADFALHMARRHSFRDQKKLKLPFLTVFKNNVSNHLYLRSLYMIYLTTFKNKNILRESAFKGNYVSCFIITF